MLIIETSTSVFFVDKIVFIDKDSAEVTIQCGDEKVELSLSYEEMEELIKGLKASAIRLDSKVVYIESINEEKDNEEQEGDSNEY